MQAIDNGSIGGLVAAELPSGRDAAGIRSVADLHPVQAEPLNGKQRLMSAVIGVVAGGAGTAATFVDGSNVGGAPLLIGVGALFAYLAVTSQRLTRLKAGGAEAELAVTRVVEKVATDPGVPEEVKADIAEAVGESYLPLSPQATNSLRQARTAQSIARLFELDVETTIARALPDLRVLRATADFGPDLTITDGTRHIDVELKFTSHRMIDLTTVQRVAERYAHQRATPLLLVSNRPLSSSSIAFLKSLMTRRFSWAWYDPSSGEGDLAEVVQALFRPPDDGTWDPEQPPR